MNSISKLKMGGTLILCFFTSHILAQNYAAPSGAGNAGTDNTSVGAGANDLITGVSSTAVGNGAGKNTTSGGYNVFIGKDSGGSNTTGEKNTFLGNSTGFSMTTGSNNTFLGSYAGRSHINGTRNVFVGVYAGANNNGNYNVILGGYTASANASGSNNTIIGYGANGGSNVHSGANNVFIGYQSGYNETLSDRLYIDNSSTTTPLVYGNFAANQLGVNVLPVSTHTLSVGGTIHATGIYVNGQSISSAESWTTSGANVFSNGGKNVGIGTTLANNPKGYKFAVNGKMGAKEIEIENTSLTWSDFVFADDYELMSLEELDQFITQHNHLPNIQTQEEVRQNGYSVSEMDAKLLQKVEELTLYVIELKKELDELKKNR